MSEAAIILAAGKGTRMNSELPKMLHEVAGRPMLAHVLDAARRAGCESLIVVVGHKADRVREAFAGRDGDVTWVIQDSQLGTGHAVIVCEDALVGVEGSVLVIAGDSPTVRPQTLREVMSAREQAGAACALATCTAEDPQRRGRIVRDDEGRFAGIVEYVDADEEQRRIHEVNVSIYCFDAAALRSAVGRLTSDNAKGEYYLTDTLEILRNDGEEILAVSAASQEEIIGVNTPEHLAEAERILAVRSKSAVTEDSQAKGSSQ